MFHFISHSTTSVLCILGKLCAKHREPNVELFRYSGALPWHLQQHCNFGSNICFVYIHIWISQEKFASSSSQGNTIFSWSGKQFHRDETFQHHFYFMYYYLSFPSFFFPLFSQEYHSVAHCTAGACASIATSFIFTPSERIKQQMQVSSHYRNCWYILKIFMLLCMLHCY